MPRTRSLVVPLLTAALCFVLAAIMIKHLSFQSNLASVWPANAVILAQLLGRSPRQWARFLVAGFLAIAAAGILMRGAIAVPASLALANTVEIGLAAWLLRGTQDANGRLLHHHASVGRFVLYGGLVAPAFGALLGAIVATVAFGHPIGISLATKFTADALGILIFTPFFFALFHGRYIAAIRDASKAERWTMLLLHSAVLVVSLAVFGQDRFPLLFVPMAPLMLVAFRRGWEGTSFGVMVVAVIGGIATFHGDGPVSLSGGDMALKLGFLQFYLATVLLLMMPVAAALAARRDLIERLSESERSLKLLADRSAIVLLRFCAEGVCTRVVGDVTNLIGEDADRLMGAHVGELSAPMGETLFDAHLRAGSDERPVTVEIERPGAVWVEATFRAEHDEHGVLVGSVATIVDVTARKAREGELARLAETDKLTGLANRAGFLRRFEDALANPPVTGLSIALIDVDRFKSFNDELGHVAGDAALAEVGRRIALNLRTTDLVARLGGDEFVVLLGTGEPDIAKEVCRRIVESVSALPVELPFGGQARAQISCGLVHRTPGQGGIDLLNRADMALYAAKRAGRNQLIAA